jgi:hypothetical protein
VTYVAGEVGARAPKSRSSPKGRVACRGLTTRQDLHTAQARCAASCRADGAGRREQGGGRRSLGRWRAGCRETGRGAGRRRRRGGPRRRSPPGLLRRSSTVKTLLQACCGAGEEARPERLPLRGSVGEQGCGLQERPSRRFGEEDGAGRFGSGEWRFGSGEDEAGRFGSGDAPSSIDVGRRRAEPRADDGGEEASLAGASGARWWGTRWWGGGAKPSAVGGGGGEMKGVGCLRRWGAWRGVGAGEYRLDLGNFGWRGVAGPTCRSR